MSSFITSVDLIELLECPTCHGAGLMAAPDESMALICQNCGELYPFCNNHPVLISATNSIFPRSAYVARPEAPTAVRQTGLSNSITEAITWRLNAWTPSRSVNLARGRIVKALADKLATNSHRRILIVGGGTQKEELEQAFGINQRPWCVYTDIDIRSDVDVFADAHDQPFKSNSFDAVITTAVLEHVLYPERVAAEIHRVLKVGGLLYSELPFMQQVHEGAYDFTRYNLSGHRRLLNGFEEIEAGMVAGPGTALVWAIESLLFCFTRRRFSKTILRFISRWAFAWLRHLDHLLKHNPTAIDGASCTYFFGAKSTKKIADETIISRYSGASHLEHL